MIGTEEKYLKAFENLEKNAEYRRSHELYSALGFTSNLDILCDFQIDTLNKLLSTYFTNEDLMEMKPSETIEDMEGFLKTIVFFCARGIGGEVDIADPDMIKGVFETKNGMGGTATQAGLALSSIKVPSIIHLTDDSKEVCEILNTPYVNAVDVDGNFVHTNSITQTNKQEIHYIVQFKKGDVIQLKGQEVVIPVSNRIIITKFTVNKTLPLSKPYFKYIEDNAVKITSNVLSSFNALEDPDLLSERLTYIAQHLEKYKQNNCNGIVFFEDAHYHDKAIRKLCLETIYSQVDIVSLNEEELEYTLTIDDEPHDINDIDICIRGMQYIRRKYGIQKGVIVHTKDYSMYVGEKLDADIEKGLIYGNLLATTKAVKGWYGTKDDIYDILEFELSPRGLEYKKLISDRQESEDIVIVPTKYIDKPKYTIGLGDSFVAGVQLCFS